VRAGRHAARHHRSAHGAAGEEHIDADRRIAA